MTPLHCAAISHSVTMKAFMAAPADVGLQAKGDEKLSCVQMLIIAGASLLSQVLQLSRAGHIEWAVLTHELSVRMCKEKVLCFI